MTELSCGSYSEMTKSNSKDKTNTDINGELVLLQLDAVKKQLPLILLSDIGAGCLLSAILFDTSSRPYLYFWIGTLLSVCAVRAWFAKSSAASNGAEHVSTGEFRQLFLGCFCSGVVWGLAWLMLPAEPTASQLVITVLWVCTLMSGAASSLSVIRPLFYAFVLPLFLLLASYLVAGNFPNAHFILSGLLVYTMAMMVVAAHVNKILNRSLRLRLDYERLHEKLRRKETELKCREKDLEKTRIKECQLSQEKEIASANLEQLFKERLLLLEAIEEGIFGVNTNGEISFVNPSALALLGYDESTVLNSSIASYFSVEGTVLPKSNADIPFAIGNGDSVHRVVSHMRKRSGDTIQARVSSKPLSKNGEVIGAVVSFTDVSEQSEIYSMLVHSQKTEAVGQVTAGIVHDFNNLLTVISGNLQLLERKVSADSKALSLLHNSLDAADSGADLVKQLLSFHRQQTLSTAPEDINEILTGLRQFLMRALGEKVQLVYDLCMDHCTSVTDRAQIENAFLNMCVNARDAMPLGGTVTICSTVKTFGSHGRPFNSTSNEKRFVEIKVIDDGVGIPQRVKDKIFDPFFTTKERSKGTGLGLSTIHTFLQQSGGDISVFSEEGRGTVFTIYLPLSKLSTETELQVKRKRAGRLNSFNGTVLVVEDNQYVKEVASVALQEAGFKVLAASNGREGLSIFRDHPEIDCVFSDVVMPGNISGLDLALEIRERKPGMPVLLATGYTEQKIRDQIDGMENLICIPKPYNTNELPSVINSLVERAAA